MNVWFIAAGMVFLILTWVVSYLINASPVNPSLVHVSPVHVDPELDSGERDLIEPEQSDSETISQIKKKRSRNKKANYQEQLNQSWIKAGFSHSIVINGVLSLILLLIVISGFIHFGVLVALILAVSFMVLLWVAAQWRRTNIRRRLTVQLPSFIDQVNRRVKVGMSIHRAIEQSSKTTSKPLSHVLERVSSRRSIGIELQDAFHKEYLITGVTQFRLLASIFNINTHFGGSITDSLDSLVQLLRQQDLSQRELKSMTGETRITGWVIGGAPILVGAYMLLQNPELLINMWNTEKGQFVLSMGFGLQAIGLFLIWRMFRKL